MSEVQDVKLFIKRGTSDFSAGTTGHVKLLSHRVESRQVRCLVRGPRRSLTPPAVLRREPVWKVSMCVGLGPAVRCSYDEEQGVLRIALKEAVAVASAATACMSAEEDDRDSSREPQVVLYALKVSLAAALLRNFICATGAPLT